MSIVGKKIGPYHVVSEIGAGGMAVVYKAEQPSLSRLVAIKELRTELTKDTSVLTRFEREAKYVAALAHQNIVHIYDFITRAGSMFMVMEYVEGIDLFTMMSRVERLPPDIAAIIALQTARALEYAHFRGVVHRDIKPSNLMITRHGDVKLMDFGIARDESHDDLTRPGIALGTPSYMSPEQILGERVDFRSDIFSFGIVLYQMLTGLKPFMEDDTRGVMNRILNETYRRPRAVYPDVPFALQRIVRRCLEKRPERRFASTEVLRRELETFVSRKVRINYNGRLLIYMHHRQLISDSDAKTYVAEEALRSPRSVVVDTGKIDVSAAVLRPLFNVNVALFMLMCFWTMLVGWTELGRDVGYLRVSVNPWAEVYVNGKFYDVTPLSKPITLAPGRHTVEFRNKYFEATTRQVEVSPGQTAKVSVELTKRRR